MKVFHGNVFIIINKGINLQNQTVPFLCPSEKLKGHIGLGLSVCLSVHP